MGAFCLVAHFRGLSPPREFSDCFVCRASERANKAQPANYDCDFLPPWIFIALGSVSTPLRCLALSLPPSHGAPLAAHSAAAPLPPEEERYSGASEGGERNGRERKAAAGGGGSRTAAAGRGRPTGNTRRTYPRESWRGMSFSILSCLNNTDILSSYNFSIANG